MALRFYPGLVVKDGGTVSAMKTRVGGSFAVRGVQMRLNWNQFQTGPTTYNWTKIDGWIAECVTAGYKLHLLVGAKGFGGTASPAFIKTDPIYEGGVLRINTPNVAGPSDNIKLWVTTVKNAFKAAMLALANRYKDNVTIGSISSVEIVFGKTIAGVTNPTKTQMEQFTDNLMEIMGASRVVAPDVVWMMFINGPAWINSRVRVWARGACVGIAGPDTYPTADNLRSNGAYAMMGATGCTPTPIGEMVDKVPLAITFNPENNGATNHGVKPTAKQNVATIVAFARDELNANFLFVTQNDSDKWYKPWTSFKTWASNLTLNPSRDSISGGMNTVVPELDGTGGPPIDPPVGPEEPVVVDVTTDDRTPLLGGTWDNVAGHTLTGKIGGDPFTPVVSGDNWSYEVPTALAPDTYAIAVTATNPALEYSTGYGELVIWTASESYTIRGTGTMCPVAELVSDIGHLDESFVTEKFQSTGPEDRWLGMSVMIDDEIVRLTAMEGDTISVARGCADTVPAPHDEGTVVWFYDNDVGGGIREYVGGETVAAKILPRTLSGGRLALSAAPPNDLTFNWRFARPYAPGKMLVNATPWFASVFTLNASGETLVFTWAHRNRVTQGDQLIEHDIASITPEVGTTYMARIYDATDALLREVTLTGVVTWTYYWSEAVDDLSITLGSGPATVSGYVRFCSRRNGLDSWQDYRVNFTASSIGTPTLP